MQNSTVESPTKKRQKSGRRINYPLCTQTPILDGTPQRKVASRIEIKLSRTQLREMQWLFTQYGLDKPTWLRGKFLLNQFRRKCLNDNLREAQLDQTYCGKCTEMEDWSHLLHALWHQINGVVPCV